MATALCCLFLLAVSLPAISDALPDRVSTDAVASLTVSDARVSEADASARVRIALSEVSSDTISVTVFTRPGTARGGSDYFGDTQILYFQPGETVQIFDVTLLNDSTQESTETFQVRITDPVNASIGDAEGTVTIVDDNDSGMDTSRLSVSFDADSVLESDGRATVTVTLSEPAQASVTVFTRAGTAVGGSDYYGFTRVLNFDGGSTTKKLTLAVLRDSQCEPEEKMTVRLVQATGAVIDTASAELTINDNCGSDYPFPPITTGLRAAPGLQGYGTDTPAGRGGRVLFITNLNDSGPGSARAALQATGRRQIISNVAGEIRLSTPIVVASEASLYGQAAPGAGLTFTMDNSAYVPAAIIIDRGRDILIQYIRVRGVGNNAVERNLIVLNGSNVVVDHSSFSWGRDQNLNSWYTNDSLTYSNNLSYEGLRANEGHSYPTLFGNVGSKGISIHHNAFVHGLGRMPNVSNIDDFSIDWNIVHNPGNWATEVTTNRNGSATLSGNVTNNWYRRVLNTNPIGGNINIKGDNGRIDVYVEGNYFFNNDALDYEDRTSNNFVRLNARFDAPEVTDPSTAKELPNTLLPHAGASLPARDANDARIVREILAGTGRAVDDIRGNGGRSQTYFPPQRTIGNPDIDINSVDGVPDSWKTANGIAPGTDLTKRDSNGDGFTDWEDWRVDVFGG